MAAASRLLLAESCVTTRPATDTCSFSNFRHRLLGPEIAVITVFQTHCRTHDNPKDIRNIRVSCKNFF